MTVKEFRQVRRDRVTIFIAILIPTIQLIIFGYAVRTDVINVRAVVFDMAQSELSRELVTRINNTGVFILKSYVLSYAEAYDSIKDGKAKVAIIIPPDFSANPKTGESSTFQVLVDGSDSTSANYASAAIEGVSAQMSAEGAVTRLSVQPKYSARTRLLFNPELKSSTFFVPALLVVILHMPLIILTSLSIVRERVEGTLEQLIVTPIGRLGLMLGKLVPFFTIGVVSGAGVLLVMVTVFKVPIRGSLFSLTLILLLWIVTSLAMGLMFSTVARTQLQAVLMAILTVVPSILLSGFMFPRESMPAVIYYITFALPMTYAVNVIRGLVIRGASVSALAIDLAVLLVFCLALLTLATKRFQKRLG